MPPNLDILSETVTDSRAAPSATPQMRALFDKLDKAASESANIIAASTRKPASSHRRRLTKRPKRESIKSVDAWLLRFLVALMIGIAAFCIQFLCRDAFWSVLGFPTLKYWYSYVPRDFLRFLVNLTGTRVILLTAPFVYPTAAAVIAFCVASAAGVGKKRIEAIVSLAGFAWDRNSFCRGWIITGATGSGKTTSAIVTQFHQVFQHEKGTLRDTWEGSELAAKLADIEERYRQETDPIHARISVLREERRKLDVELEAALQQSLIGDIDYHAMRSEERAQHAESIKAELQVSRNERVNFLRRERVTLMQQLGQLNRGSDEDPGVLATKIESCQSTLEQLDREIADLQSDSFLEHRSIAGVQYQEVLRRAKSIDEEIGRIEWRELHPIKQQFDELLKRIESAKYKSFPWGGLCIDEKGLFWQTLVPIARHYKREHHLMLLQTRPDWAPAEWRPHARFNLLSDPKIKASTYAKAIVDTALSVSGGGETNAFFVTQAQKWIEASIELQWGVREFQIANGVHEKNAILPSLKRCYDITGALDSYRAWLISENVLQPEQTDKRPAAVAETPAAAKAKKLAGLVPEDPQFLKALPERLRRTLISFRSSFWSQPADQLGGVITTISNYLTYFSGDDVAEVFCADNTFDIKDIDRGMILLLAMPQKLATERRYVCTLLKLLFYQHVSDRFDLKSDSEAWINKNVLILWQDEAQSFASEADKVVDKIREAYGTTVMATQSMLSLFPALGGREKAEVVLLNLRNRVVFQVADEESAKITADFIGKKEVTRKDRSVSVSGRQHTTYNYRKEEQHKIKPAVLRELPKYTAVVYHCDGKFRKVLLPPRDHEGKIAQWWLDRDAPFFFKCGVKLGLIK